MDTHFAGHDRTGAVLRHDESEMPDGRDHGVRPVDAALGDALTRVRVDIRENTKPFGFADVPQLREALALEVDIANQEARIEVVEVDGPYYATLPLLPVAE